MNPFILSTNIYLPGTGDTEVHEADASLHQVSHRTFFFSGLVLLWAGLFKNNNHGSLQMVAYQRHFSEVYLITYKG